MMCPLSWEFCWALQVSLPTVQSWHLLQSMRGGVAYPQRQLLPCGCWDCCKDTPHFFLIVLVSGVLLASGRFLVKWCPLACEYITPISACLFPRPSSPCLGLSLCAHLLLDKDTHPWIQAYLNYLILTFSVAKTLFPSKVTFIDPGRQDFNIFSGGHNPPHDNYQRHAGNTQSHAA